MMPQASVSDGACSVHGGYSSAHLSCHSLGERWEDAEGVSKVTCRLVDVYAASVMNHMN